MYTEESNVSTTTEFDINSPELGSYVPGEIDPNATPVRTYPPPPDDGIHLVVLRLNEKNEKGGVYLKGEKDAAGNILDAKVVADFVPHFLNEDGTEGQFIKNWYATSVLLKGQKASSISGFCYLAGKPFKVGNPSLGLQKSTVERICAEAGEAGVIVKAKTRWVKSYQKTDESGMPVFKKYSDGSDVLDAKGNPVKEYVEIKTQKKILRLATIDALKEVISWEPREGQTAEQFQKEKDDWVANAASRAHIFVDPVSGNDLQVQVEIDQLVEE